MKVTILGCGVVGSSWAVVFARAGNDVLIHDPQTASAEAALDFVRKTDAEAAKRCSIAPDLETALKGADYVQESAPERLPIKQALYRQIDALLGPATVVASSTSGLPASAFTEGLTHGARYLVAHPINPPHLIPLVELIPAPWTSPETLAFVGDLMRSLGQSPITLAREINGFVVNRLQSALLGEAFRLVEDGICSPTDVDLAISEGLGLRWCFLGPFATIDLNAAQGIKEYCQNLGPMYFGLAQEQADPREWSPDLVARIEADMRALVPLSDLPSRRYWRDGFLAELVRAKRAIAEGLNT
ncbi:3-hydroxyacyl-CoA dehydrogenase [Acidisoma cellulosilytica]|uniref:3-hydroxyacyl-CoA dehydrogenase n=1 Tax=Acidisoma cellulosilyticum TaxID=2802395 RepID=A0A964E5B9_9PROT|nr:3-hydroxyacyl-CoA dehydrogenase [Acidisoma cellulosilyticum]MCB8882257.1 3-hydroxyacyl-CoA dehydrogenase [Acidisoma cellulosilyticum]